MSKRKKRRSKKIKDAITNKSDVNLDNTKYKPRGELIPPNRAHKPKKGGAYDRLEEKEKIKDVLKEWKK